MHTKKDILSFIFTSLSLTYAWMLVAIYAPGFLPEPKIQIPFEARVITQQLHLTDLQWKTITPSEIDAGATVPAGVNTIFTLPFDIPPVRRETLFAHSGVTVRYWGYCFEEGTEMASSYEGKFPGKLFLSEKERTFREDRIQEERPVYSIFAPPRKPEDLERPKSGPVRHEMEIFQPGSTCYVMTEKPIPIGSDRDDDGLNAQEERSFGTLANNPDTDNDGSLDGTEAAMLRTDPLRRDSDGDGIIDGLEDANRNGRIDQWETDPTKKDTDGDLLCDGYCRVFEQSGICKDNKGQQCKDLIYGRWMGEDRNLNGKVDTGETDPRLWSSKNNGISDMQNYYKCILDGGKDC